MSSSATYLKGHSNDFDAGTFDKTPFTMATNGNPNGMHEIPGDNNGVELMSVGRPDGGATRTMSDEGQLVNYDDQVGSGDSAKSGLGKASYNMINSIIGAGIIGLPFAVAQAGFIFGVILLFFMAALTDYSLRLLVESGLLIGVSSYQATMEKMFGKVGFYVLSVCQFFYPFFAMIGYTVIIGDTIPKVLEQAGAGGVLINDKFIKFCVTLLIMWPLSLYRNISNLGKVSFVAIMFILFLCVVVLTRTEIGSTADFDKPPFHLVNYHIAESLSIMTFAYMCHHNTFLIYNSLNNASMERYSKVVHISVFSAFIVAFILAVGGYVTFRSGIKGDLLENYCVDDTLVNIARVGYAFVVMFTFPIEMFVCREVITILYRSYRGYSSSKSESLAFHVVTTLSVGVLVLAIGIPVGKLDVVLEFSGAMFGTPLAFIFPPAVFLRATWGQGYNVKRILAFLCLVFGMVLMIIGTVVAIIEASKGVVKGDEVFPYCMNGTNNGTNFNGTNFTSSTMSPITTTSL